MPEKSLLVRSESARRDDQQKKTNDAGCSEQTFPKTCLKKFPRLQVKAAVQKPIDEALSALEGYREGSRAQYSKRLRTLSRDSPDQINEGLHRRSGGAIPLTRPTATASEPRHARRLVAATHRHVDVIGLLLREHGELRAERWEVEAGDLLVEILREEVDLVSLVLPAVALLPELELREGLVRERARHDEGRVASGAAQ